MTVTLIEAPTLIEARTLAGNGPLVGRAERVWRDCWQVYPDLPPLSEQPPGWQPLILEVPTRAEAIALLLAAHPAAPPLDPVDEAAAQAVTALGIGGSR